MTREKGNDMLQITRLEDGLAVFKALGSEIRVRILTLLLEENDLSMKELAARLNITGGALTSHIHLLEECGLIRVSSQPGGRGNQKICSINQDKILIEFNHGLACRNVYSTSIPVGHYCDCDVYPTCGLAAKGHVIGTVDDRRYFFHDDRFEADILWFTKGYVEYAVPNFIPYGQNIDELCFSLEICSEAPGVNNNWPSDIYFYINNVEVAMWTSPGDFGDRRGLLTPDWWFPDWNQYGLMKILQITRQGTFVDGVQKSEVTIDSFHFTDSSTIKFRIAAPEQAANAGGVTIFGKSFGNYNQDINVRITYSPRVQQTPSSAP